MRFALAPNLLHPSDGWRRLWLVAVALAAAVVVACGGPESSSGNGPPEGAAASTEGSFPIAMYQGQEVVGADELDFAEILQQGKPVVLNFWAGLCPPCRAEMPSFQRMYDEHKDDLILIGVDVGPFVGLGSGQDALNLMEELGITYPTGQAQSAQAVRGFSILSMPSTVYFDADGQEFARHAGFLTEGQLRDQVEELLNAAP